jgi:hypothetical protein
VAFVRFSEETAFISLNSIKKLVFVMEITVLCLAGTRFLIIWSKFRLEMGSEDSEKSK